MQHAGGMLLRPVQTLVDTIIFALRAKMQIESTIPHAKQSLAIGDRRLPRRFAPRNDEEERKCGENPPSPTPNKVRQKGERIATGINALAMTCKNGSAAESTIPHTAQRAVKGEIATGINALAMTGKVGSAERETVIPILPFCNNHAIIKIIINNKEDAIWVRILEFLSNGWR